MGRMARHTALCLLRRMLEDERSMRLHVATPADLLLRRRRTQLPRQEAAMLVVAFSAAQQALVNAMMERAREFAARVRMAAVTELRLGSLQQPHRLSRMMYRMTIQA